MNYYLHKLLNFFRNKKDEPAKAYGWFDGYTNWHEVEKLCKGYDDALIFEKVKKASVEVKKGNAVFERDSVLFYEAEYNPDFLKIIEQIASENNNEVHVLDFGGALGSLYYQYKPKLAKFPNVSWSVIEQKHFVEFGKKELENEQLRFYYTIEECITNNSKINMVLLSSVISYIKDPYELLNTVLKLNCKYILIDKNIFTDHEQDILTRQIVPPAIYDASYPCWILNKNKLIKFMSANYTLQTEYFPYNEALIKINDKTAYFKALLFKKNDD